MEELNGPDIIKYVNGKFDQNVAYNRLVIREPNLAPKLIQEIIDKSQGVFLWVRIVVENILWGIGNNGDNASESLRRLRAMPPELEPLYEHLLSLIKKRDNMVWASKAFQITRAVREFCSEDSAGPIRRDKGSTPLSILMLHLALENSDQMYIVFEGHEDLTPEVLDNACADAKVRVTARCAGFLEVPTFERNGASSQIEYLHRTSRDFLEKKEVWSRLLNETAQSGFDAHRAMLHAQIRWLSICLSQTVMYQRIDGIVHRAMLHARYTVDNDDVDVSGEQITLTTASLVDELDALMNRENEIYDSLTHWTHSFSHDIYGTPLELPPGLELAGYAALYGLHRYVESKISDAFDIQLSSSETETIELEQTTWTKTAASNILHAILRYTQYHTSNDSSIPLVRPNTVIALLNLGADPNYAPGYTYIDATGHWPLTTWQNMLDFAANHYDAQNMAANELHTARFTQCFVDIMCELIDAGAWFDVDDEGMTPELWGWKSIDELVKECVIPVFPAAGKRLLKTMQVARLKRLKREAK